MSNFGVIAGKPPKFADIPVAGVWAVSTREREDFTVVLNPPKAAAVKVEEAKGVSSPKRVDGKRLRVDRLSDDDVGAAARMLLFFFVTLRLVVVEVFFLLFTFTVEDTSWETVDATVAATFANSSVKSAPWSLSSSA